MDILITQKAKTTWTRCGQALKTYEFQSFFQVVYEIMNHMYNFYPVNHLVTYEYQSQVLRFLLPWDLLPIIACYKL